MKKVILTTLFFLFSCTANPSAFLLLFGGKEKSGVCLFCFLLLNQNKGSNSPTTQGPNSQPLPQVVDYTVSPSERTIQVGELAFFTAINSQTNETIDSGVEWSVENTSIGTIASNGQVTGVAMGTTIIKAKWNGVEKTANLTVLPDTTAPSILSASSVSPTLIRVVFSEPVNNVTTSSLKIITGGTGTCSNNTNFTANTSSIVISSITVINPTTFDLNLASSQITNTLYTLVGNKTVITDLAATPNQLGCPNNADFIGNEVLKVSSISCNSTSNIVVSFSKPVKTGINVSGSAECNTTTECNNRYKINGATDLGNILSARVLNGSVCGGLAADSSKVCLTTSLLQNGAIYSVVSANNTNGDGFDNLAWGAIRNSADTENLQSSPKDRGSFFGCGIPSVNFVDGPIIVDPFTDGSDFGFLTTFSNKVYIGPNKTGNAASRFNADGSSPQSITFSFEKDITGNAAPPATGSTGRQSRNTASAPFYSIGGVGCTPNSNSLTGCGPDNQDGRGLFVSGMLNGQEYMFISGYVSTTSQPNNDYLYFSNDLDTNFSFRHMDTSRVFDTCPGTSPSSPNVTQNQGTDSIEIFNNRIYWSVPGNGPNRPFIAKLNPPNPLLTSVDIDCDTTGVESHFINSRWIAGFGNQYNVTANPAPQTVHGPAEPLRASSDMLGAVIQNFNDKLYMMNSGSIRYNGTGNQCISGSVYSAGVCEQTGGFTRSISNNPKTCLSDTSCSEWINITPNDTRYKQFFSIGLPTSSVTTTPISAQKPVPKIESFQGNLYAIRNSCRTVLMDLFTSSCNYPAQCTNDSYCASGDERPQLWKCEPSLTGSATDCDSDDWSLVADNGSGFTNFGDSNNKQITMLQPNGNYLYVGFDNPNGIKVYRTNIANPSTESNFSQIGGDGFLNTSTNKQIYSTISIQNGSIYFVYASVGQNSTPVRVHRQQNN